MLIASGLVTSLLVTPGAVASAAAAPIPTVTVNVIASSDLAPSLVSALLEEASAIWRAAGIRFVWQRAGRALGADLCVLIGGGRSDAAEERLPLGWIAFADERSPAPEIYVSYMNALGLLSTSRGTVGSVGAMPIAQRETYLSRAMGRVLAHELGHYLFASKHHTEKGLMRGSQTSAELFGPSRAQFTIDRALQDQLAVRFAGTTLVASR